MIKTGEIPQEKDVRKYFIPRLTLERKCKKKRENVAEKRSGLTPVLGEEAEKGFVHWGLTMQKQGLPVGWGMLIQKAQEIH